MSPALVNEANRRFRQRYKIMRLLGVNAKESQIAARGSTRFRDALEALGVSPSRYPHLCMDRRRMSHWHRVSIEHRLPRYHRPVPVRTVDTDLGNLSMPIKYLLVGAGVALAEDGNAPEVW